MIGHKKFLLHLLTPVLACSMLSGIGFAQTSSTTTQTQSTRASKRAAKKAAKEEKAKQAAAAKSTTPAPAATPMAKTETAKAPRKTSSAMKSSTMTSTASAGDISNARAKGMVWVNTQSKVYHKDGKYYGNTKHGQFMTEADAQKAGYKAAKR